MEGEARSEEMIGRRETEVEMLKQGYVEGTLEPFDAPVKTIGIFAERIPSWLAVVDNWNCEAIMYFCEKEELWFREALELRTEVRRVGTLAGMRNGRWFKEERRLVLVQGTSEFCRKVLLGLKEWGICDKDMVGVVLPNQLRNLPLAMNFIKLPHSHLGGVTTTPLSIGLSKTWKDIEVKKPTAELKRKIEDIASVTEGGLERNKPDADEIPSQEPKTSELCSKSFVLRSVFKKSGWVTRLLTPVEIAIALDFPVGCVSRLKDHPEFQKNHVEWTKVPPVKAIQWAGHLVTGSSRKIKVNGKSVLEEESPENEKIQISSQRKKGLNYSDQEIYSRIEQTKAVKNDDALTDFDIWNRKASETTKITESEDWLFVQKTPKTPTEVDPTKIDFMNQLRTLSLKRYRKNIAKSFTKYLREKYSKEEIREYLSLLEKRSVRQKDLHRDIVVGRIALEKVNNASFWEWDEGSAPIFWRWQPEVQKDVRDGTKIWVTGELPVEKARQIMPADKDLVEKLGDKIDAVRVKGYISDGHVISITHFFAVAKGEGDIRVVYNLSRNGLNEALWTPSFWMPTMMNVLDLAIHSSWFCDVDVGEMFLNFPLHPHIRPHCGVDLSWQLKGKGCKWERWNRMAMGMSPSPWVCTRLMGWMMEMVKGDPKQPGNPFGWNSVILNLPGMETYNPSMPRCYKWNEETQSLATDVHWFMDDFRTCGASEEAVQAGTHKLESMMSYLGIQDATRKRRNHGQHVGEWVGAISVSVENIGLFQTVSEKKWNKAKEMISDLLSKFENSYDRVDLNHKDLERKTGFLVHLSMVFGEIAPFLKGFYLTLNSWRAGRSAEGWKLSARDYEYWMTSMQREGVTPENEEEEVPTIVRAVPCFFQHLSAINELLSSEMPTLKLIRGSAISEIGYVFGDASGSGYGVSEVRERDDTRDELYYRYGIWGPEEANESSNYKEFNNLVVTLEDAASKNELEGKEIFVFTDNAVTEAIAAKGSSSSPKLFDLVVRLFKLNMIAKCKIQFIHVAGTRMIAQGTDGLSRGNLLEGVMQGKRMSDFIPLHLSAIDRSPILKEILTEVLHGIYHSKVEFLTEQDWFWRGHDISGMRKNIDGMPMPEYRSGTMVWSPPPAAGRFAVEQLRQARHKRQKSFHVLILPRLMNLEWRRHTMKGADCVFDIPVGVGCWDKDMHEPLTIAFFFPYMDRKPWELRQTTFMVDMARDLSRMFKESESAGWDLLSKFLSQTRKLEDLSFRQLCRVLQGQ